MTLALASSLIAVIVIVALLVLFAIVLNVSFLRARRAARMHEALAVGEETGEVPSEAPAAPAAPKAQKIVTRRDFFRKSWLASLTLFGVQFGAASVAFLWPNLKGGFGSVFTAGTVADIKGEIDATNQPFYFGAGRFYIVPYSGSGKDPATGVDYVTAGITAEGLMPLYQRCVHLGCRVPFCQQSQWFECPCHGSKYNQAGEYKLGPAPRGMDRFKIKIDGGTVTVDTSTILLGPPRGTDTIKQNPEGPFCV